MKTLLKIITILIFVVTSTEVQAQYWVRSDITMNDADVVIDAQIELAIRINGNDIISLMDQQDGNSNESGPRAVVNRAYNGAFPNQVQFFDFASGFAITPPDPGQMSLCYNGFGGSSTTNVPTNGSLFLGPFDGGNNTTYFGCDDIIDRGPVAQFFQVWRLRNLTQPSNNTRCIEESIVLNPGNFGSSIRSVQYRTSTSGPFQTLASFADPVNSYTVELSTVPNLTPGNIMFRLNYGNGIFTNIVTYSITGCSPDVIDIAINDPDCAGDDGGFTVTFEEALNGDTLSNIGVRSPGPNGVFETPFDLSTDDILIGAQPNTAVVNGDQFTYPNGLPSGIYVFRYQTNNSNSVVESDPFTIVAPPPIEYIIEVASELSCFDSEDGAVQITINPNNNGSIGTPPYYYTIDNGAQMPFTSINTIVSGLGSNQIQFKVFDSNDCTERL